MTSSRYWTWALRAAAMVSLVLATLTTAPAPAHAEVDGTPPSALASYRVFGDSVSIGNTLMDNVPSAPLVNARLRASSSADIAGAPADAELEAGWLFWSGSVDDDVGVDRTVNFTAPDGRTRTVTADTCLETRASFGGGLRVDFFYCRANVTSVLAPVVADRGLNGRYTVGGVTAMPGLIDASGTCIDPSCQAMYAGWSMVAVWSSPTETTVRDVALFDGFQLFDETPVSAAVDSYTISGFDIANPPEASFRFFGMEGDALLGVPPQDSDPVLRCDTCFDYIAINGVKLSDGFNPENNLFNSTVPSAGGAIGVDIDVFDISARVRSGDSSVRIEVGSGDGNPRTGHDTGGGGGELFLVGYNVLTINRLAPNFRTDATFMTVDPTTAAPGETLFYTIQVTNEGSRSSTGTRLFADLPDGAEYVPGSTLLDGEPVADVGGTSPLFGSGLALGTVPATGDNDRRVTYRLRVAADTPNGTILTSQGRIVSAELDDDTLTNETQVRVVAPELQTPTKTFTDLNGGNVEPGDVIQYTVTFRKDADASAAALTFTDDISSFAQLTGVNASGFTDESDLSGGSAGTGQVRITDITLPRGIESLAITFTVRVKTVPELEDAGVDPSDIDGLLVSNQGFLTAAFIEDPLATDDPAVPGVADPTNFRISSSVNFRNASTFKRVSDVNGGAVEPGDELLFTISIRNAGSTAASIDLVDDLPAGLVGAELVSTFAGLTLRPAPAGANGTGRLEAFGVDVGARTTLTARVRAFVGDDVDGGTRIQNIAELRVPSFPDQDQDLTTGELIVVAGPDFSAASKVASGGVGGFEPGDEVTYTIAFTNDGTRAASNTFVTDIVDGSLTSIRPADGGVYNAGTRTIRWDIGDVPVGGTREVSFTARIAVTVPDGTSIPNQAFVAADGIGSAFATDDPTTAATDDPTIIRVQALPEIRAEKTVADVTGGAFEPGNTVRYTIVIANEGRAAATNVVVTDPLPGSALVDLRPLDGGGLVGSTVTWTATTTPALASIPPGGAVTLRVEGVISSGVENGEVVENQAALTAAPGIDVITDDPTTGAISDPTGFTVSAQPDLSATEKTVVDENGGAAQPGDVLTYTIRIVNEGSGPARDIVVTDPIDVALDEIAPLDGGFFDEGARTITWTPAGAVVAGGELELRFRARVAPGTADGTIVRNQAEVESADAPLTRTDDPSTPTVDDPTAITIESRPDFATSTKEVFHGGGRDEFRPGDEVVYAIRVVNSGTEAATNVVVTDDVPTDLLDIEVEGGTLVGGQARWTVPSLGPGEEVTVGLRGTLAFPLDDGTLVSNQAFVASAGVSAVPTDDPATPEDDDPTVFEVTSQPDLSGTIKTFTDADGGSVRPGDRVDYVILVLNSGTEAARNVVVRDVLPDEVELVDAGDAIVTGNTLEWNASTTPGLARVEVGEGGAVELRVGVQIVEPLDNGTIVSNQATLTSGDASFVSDDPLTADESDPTSFQVISAFDFSDAIKLASPSGADGYRPGEEVTWTINFSNTGDAVGRNVTVRDVLPDELEFVSASPGGGFDGSAVVFTPADVPALASVAPGDSITLRVVTRVTFPLANGTPITNQAEITAPGLASPFVSDDPTTDAVDDATTILVTAAPDLGATTLAVADVDGDGLFEPGDVVEYTVSVVNNGDAPATGASVRLPLDITNLTSIEPLDGGSFDGAGAVWTAASTPNLASIRPGDGGAVIVRVRAQLRAGLADGLAISAQGRASSAEVADVVTDDPANGVGDDDPTVFEVTSAPRLNESTKSVVDLDGAPLQAGDRLEYTIVARNDGTEPAAGVVVTDGVPEDLVDIEVLDDGAFDGSTITWTVGALAPGEARSLRFTATVRPEVDDNAVIANQAFLAATGLDAVPSDDPSTDEEDDATEIVVDAFADLSASTKVAADLNGGFVTPGDRIRYTIQVANTGLGIAERVVVTDPIDTTLLEDIEVTGGRFDGTNVVFDAATTPELERVEASAVVDLVYTAVIRADAQNGDRIRNQATIVDALGREALTDDPATPTVDDPTFVTVDFPELALSTKTVVDLDGGEVEPGDRLLYRIAFGAGAGPAVTDVRVEDALDPLLVDITPLGGGVYDAGANTLTWSRADTPALASVSTGQRVTLEFEATVSEAAPDGAEIANQALVSSAELPVGALTDDPNTPDVDDATVVRVVGQQGPDLSTSTKTVDDLNGDLVEPGDELLYTIVVANTGVADTEGLTLIDPAPPLTSYVSGSLTIAGLPVPDDDQPLGAGLAIGELSPGQSIEVSFRVVVAEDAFEGAVISNQAIASDDTGALARTDDPSTPEDDDPTAVVVGAAPDVSRTIKTVVPVDENEDGFAQPGETLEYTIEIPNRGTAPLRGAVFVDDLPANTLFQEGTLAVNGQPLTETVDGDGGQVVDRTITVELPTIEPGATARVTFVVGIVEGTVVSNQGAVVTGFGEEPTDDDGNPANGDSPTVTRVDGLGSALTATKQVADANGGRVEAGDTLLYTITLRADAEIETPPLVVDRPDGGLTLTEIVAAPSGVTATLSGGEALLELADFEAGEERVVVIAATIDADVDNGTVLCNRLEGDLQPAPEPACIAVGGRPGVVELSGTVYREPSGANGVFDDGDEPLEGYLVRVVRRGLTQPVAEFVTGADGRYEMPPLTPGAWELRTYANGGPDFGGALFASEEADVVSGESREVNLLVDPSGIIYDAIERGPVGGVRVSIFYDDTEPDPFLAGERVDPARLADPSQQDQVVPASGFYRFDVEAGHVYRIQVDALAATRSFPSTRIPANDDILDVDGRVDVVDTPDPALVDEGSEEYWLRFSIDDTQDGVFNNHIPVDPFETLVSLTKRADVRSAYVGDIITYTITVANASTSDVVYDPRTQRGGGWVLDAIPDSFRYVDGSAVGLLRSGDVSEPVNVAVEGDLLLRFGREEDDGDIVPLTVPAGGELELRYHLVVGSSTEPGASYRNRAELVSFDQSIALSNVDTASVRIDYDPVFDQGVLIGKVFCDDNGDGRQQEGEVGLSGARVYLDIGAYTEVDRNGQYHFVDIDPGLHLVKIDTATLPPGSTLTTEEQRAFNVTRGLPTSIDFGVTCAENRVSQIEVVPGDEELADAARRLQERTVVVAGSLATGDVAIEGVTVPWLDVTLNAGVGEGGAPAPANPRTWAEDADAGVMAADEAAGTDGEGEDADADAAPAGIEAAPPVDVAVRVVNGPLVEPVEFSMAASAGTERWVIEAVNLESGLRVWQDRGEGMPPATYLWDGTGARGLPVLAPQKTYEVVVRTFGAGARTATSAPVRLLVAGTEQRWLVDERFSGDGFRDTVPTRELTARLDEIAPLLVETAPQPVRIETHLDDIDDRDDEMDITVAQAEAVQRYLVDTHGIDAGRIELDPQGIETPLYPNIGDRSRLTNRRVEVRVPDPEPGILPADPPPAVQPVVALFANERAVEAAQSGDVETRVQKPSDGLVAFQWVAADGSRRGALLVVEEGETMGEVARTSLPGVPVAVDLDAGEVRVGDTAVALDALTTAVEPMGVPGLLEGRRLVEPVEFAIAAPASASNGWRLEVDGPAGLVQEFTGSGPAPATVRWTGDTLEGDPLVEGLHEARLTVRLTGGGLATSPPARFDVIPFDPEAEDPLEGYEPPAEVPAPAPTVAVNGATLDGGPATWSTTVSSMSGRRVWVDITSGDARAVLPVVVPAGFGPTVERTLELPTPNLTDNEPYAPYLTAPMDPVVETPPTEAPAIDTPPVEPSTEPVTPAPSPSEPSEPDAPFSPFAPVGESAPAEPTTAEPTTAEPTPVVEPAPIEPAPAESTEDAADEEGEDEEGEDEEGEDEGEDDPAPAPEAPEADEPPAAEPDNPFQPISSNDVPWLALRPGQAPTMQLQLSPFAPVDEPAGDDADTETPADDAGAEDAIETAEPVESGSGPNRVADDTSSETDEAPTPDAAVAEAPPRWDDISSFYAEDLDAALAIVDEDAIAAMIASADAGQIDVQLPPPGVPLESDRLSVFGTTHPDNRVWVNGSEVENIDGAFATVAQLPSGESVLLVETEDTAGNRGRIEWPVEVADVRWFMLAMGDTAVGTRHADIAGRHDHNSIETDSGAVLYGQARAYFKGWMSGEEILDGWVEEYTATAFVDTGRRREYESFIRETIQTDRYYPVFGDESQQVSDVNARGKVYVLLTADDSTATFGNFNTGIEGVELLRYDRNLYGAQVVLDDVFADDYRTELRVHVADEDAQTARTFNYMRGTGGSIYYLEQRDVIEGSERLNVVIRDRVSGIELARYPLSRNVDYTMRYGEGRVLLKSPLPSVVDDSFVMGNYGITRSTLGGHPVFLEVAYDYEGDALSGDLSYGIHGRETFHDLVTVGAGIIEENRAGGAGYQLYGAELGLGMSANTRIDLEYARSESNDLEYGQSTDGGLTWGRFRLDDTEDESGDAWYARGRLELADLIETERTAILGLDLYYHDEERGFFSNGNVLDQGETKWGTLARWRVTENHTLAVRHDSVSTTVDDLTTEDDLEDLAQIDRQVTSAQYEYQFDPVSVALAWQHTYADDIRAEDAFENDIAMLGLQYQAARWLRLGIDQEIVARGEDPRLIRGSTISNQTRVEDRFITGVTAGVQLGQDIEIEASERFRYSGENSAMVGLRAGIDEESDVYVQQRMTSYRDNHGTASTTVVGGEQRYGADGTGRSYGEYHLDSGMSEERSRAVLGFGREWEVVDDLSFDIGYERSQQLTGESSDSRASRDTLSFGWDFLHGRDVRLSGLLEGRFDRGSLLAPSPSACLGDDLVGNPSYCQDRITSVGDRRQLAWMTSLAWKWTQDLTYLARFDMVFTDNLTLNVAEARDVEATTGVAYRPVDVNWLNVLTRYTYLDEIAPYGLELNERRRESSHVFSVTPIFELPYNLQLVEKVAVRHIQLDVEGMPVARNNLVMLINRVNYHLTSEWDVGVEYRFLHQSLTQDWRHGTLFEVNYILQDHVRLGLGYNFTRFAEDELGDFDRNAQGIFFRITAQY